MYRTCLLDLDGVIQNFAYGGYRAHNKLGEYIEGVTPDRYDWWKAWEPPLTTKEFFGPIHSEGTKFWTDLPLYPHAKAMIDLLTSGVFGELIVATMTSPMYHESSFAGKGTFIQEMFGSNVKFQITNCKEKMGRPGWALIDDADTNCEEFAARGGEAILFPQPWNENRKYKDRAYEYTVERLYAWKDLQDQIDIDAGFALTEDGCFGHEH